MQSFKRKLGNLLFSGACCAIFITATPVFAQIDTGGVTGTVVDSTGAIVPDAGIKLINDETAVVIAARSTSTGAYSFNAVRPGSYTLQAEAPGFQTVIDKGVQVHLQQTATIDIHFVTGAVSQQVTVTAAAPLLQAESGAVGQTITGHIINSMPLKSRNWASLAQLSAGVVTAPKGQPSGDSGTTDSAFFSVNGVLFRQGRQSLRAAMELPDAVCADDEPDCPEATRQPRFHPGGLCRQRWTSPGQPGLLQFAQPDSAHQRERAELRSIPQLRSKLHLRNHQRNQQLQLHAGYL